MWEIFSLGGDPYPGWDNAKTFKELERGYRMSMPAAIENQLSDRAAKDTLYEVSWTKVVIVK